MSIIDKTYSRKKQLAINLISQIIAYVVSIGVSFFITPYITAKASFFNTLSAALSPVLK